MKDMYTLGPYTHDYVTFPELGSGSQFHVFDMHNGRVVKLPLTKQETRVIIKERRHNRVPLVRTENANLESRVQTIINGKGRIPSMITHSFYNPKDFLSLIGNPTLVDADSLLPQDNPDKQWGAGRVVYAQDKLAMVADILNVFSKLPTLKQGDILRLRQIIDLYVEQTYKLWEFGYADYVFKLGDTGFDANNNLVLADLGEYSSDPDFIIKVLSDRRWLHATIPDKIDFPQMPKSVQGYYIKTLDNAFSKQKFVNYWKKKHRCSTCDSSNDAISTFIRRKMAEIDLVDRW